jgi:ribosomal protein S18 acetylase RimI-like enzyme
MATTLQTHKPLFPSHLRAVDMSRDLKAVADLVELCFAKTLDADGRRYIRQMRAAARNPRAMAVADRATTALHGFVWEEDGKIVGNLSLLPVLAEGRRSYFLANVAVHPDYRRRGIARSLTEAALEFTRQKGISSVWLQVNEENPGAIQLYKDFGFKERTRRTTWHSSPHAPAVRLPASIAVGPRRSEDWHTQRQWLEHAYPKLLRWHLTIHTGLLKPGFLGAINRIFSERNIRQWSATQRGDLIGTVSWQSSYSQADWLWLAASPQHQELAILSLLPHVQKSLNRQRMLALNYPADVAVSALESVGFRPHQTLLWMHASIG